LEPEIEEFMLCSSSDPLCVQGTNKEIIEYLNGMEEEFIHNDPYEQVNQGHPSYIELWFLKITEQEHHSL